MKKDKVVYFITRQGSILSVLESSEDYKNLCIHKKLYKRIHGMDQEVEIEE